MIRRLLQPSERMEEVGFRRTGRQCGSKLTAILIMLGSIQSMCTIGVALLIRFPASWVSDNSAGKLHVMEPNIQVKGSIRACGSI